MRTRRVKQSRRGGLPTGLLRSAMCRSLTMTDGDCYSNGNQRESNTKQHASWGWICLGSGPTSLRTRRVKQSRRGGLSTGLLLFARNDGRIKSVLIRENPRTFLFFLLKLLTGVCYQLRSPHQTARLLGLDLFRKRVPMGIAIPNSTPLGDGYCFGSGCRWG
ncbi:MAG: hypothetical protein LBT00_00820 [Spirochaetaceae bacterium]|nr:hypothetical protein [Spirochaetaceae bacterium]